MGLYSGFIQLLSSSRHEIWTLYQKVHKTTGSVFLLLLPNVDAIWNSFTVFPESCKALIKLYFPPPVKHSFISRSYVVCCCCRVRGWKVCFFRGPAVAPAMLQVLTLLRGAGGLRLLPRPWLDSVHRLQQRRLTGTNYTCGTCTPSGKNVKHCWHQQRNFQTSALHMNTAVSLIHSQCTADTKLSIYSPKPLSAFSTVKCLYKFCINVLLYLYDFFLHFLWFAHQRKNEILST